ncbi:MAG: InlB B-repeat-containing protein, partial [Clostridiales bacterium]|nr:InlB B-repeat-containing protein [Clostridiales bacterium]
GANKLTPDTDYTVSDGTITFKAAYLESLAVDNYTLTVYYNPLGETFVGGDEPATTAIALTVATSFVPVTDIDFTSVSTTGTVGVPVMLSGTVAPTTATNQTITWARTGGTADASIVGGNSVVATEPGTVEVRAYIEDGTAVGTAFTKYLTITFSAAATYSIDVIGVASGGSHTFTAALTGYAPITPTGLTVSNTGTGAMTDLDIALSGGSASDFTLDMTSLNKTLASGGTTSFTIKPNDGLGVGNYTEVVTITDANITSYTFTVSFTVSAVTTHTVTFNGNGGTPSEATRTVTDGAAIGTLPTATRSGSYTFNGWFTAASGGTQITAATVITGDVTYYAQWTYTGGSSGGTATYTVKFEANGGSAASNQSVSSGGKATKPSDPTKEGYTFAGWCSDAALTTEYDFSKAVTSNITIYAKWTEKSVITPPTDEVTPPTDEKWKNPFEDVKSSDWFYGDVEYVYTNGLMVGTSTDPMLLSPNMTTTRGMIVTILYRLEGEPDVSDLTNPFDEVAAGTWYTDAVIWAAGNGIVSGYGGGKFGPEDSITRQDLAVILNNYAKSVGIKLPAVNGYKGFNDDADIANYAKDAIERFFEAGIIAGKPGNIFDPKGDATRAEVAAMLHRFLEATEE